MVNNDVTTAIITFSYFHSSDIFGHLNSALSISKPATTSHGLRLVAGRNAPFPRDGSDTNININSRFTKTFSTK